MFPMGKLDAPPTAAVVTSDVMPGHIKYIIITNVTR